MKIWHVTGRLTEQGWLLLTKLTRLEYLELPKLMLLGGGQYNKEQRLKQEISLRMPQTIVK